MRLAKKFYLVFFCERKIIADQQAFFAEERQRKDSINKGNDRYQIFRCQMPDFSTGHCSLFAICCSPHSAGLIPYTSEALHLSKPHSPIHPIPLFNPSTSQPFSTYLSYSIYPIPLFIPFPYSSFLNAVSINQ